MTTSAAVELLAVVEVPRSERVYCQHANCSRPVFRRIHIIRTNDGVTFVGSGCFRKYYAKLESRRANLATKQERGVRLTAGEVRMLIENTEKLLAVLEQRYAPAVGDPKHQCEPRSDTSDRELWQYALNTTKQTFRDEKGIDPELPGWAGWVNREAKKLFQQLKKNQQ